MELFFNIIFMVSWMTVSFSLEKKRTSYLIRSFGDTIESAINTEDGSPAYSISDSTITEIIAIPRAVAARLAPSKEEASEFLEQVSTSNRVDATLKSSASRSRQEATYYVWGDHNQGGSIPAIVYATLNQDFGESHPNQIIRLNDLCALQDAFIGIYNGIPVCWGEPTTCTGWNKVFEDNSQLIAEKIFCPANALAALVVLSAPHPIYKGFISVFGNPEAGGNFSTSIVGDSAFPGGVQQDDIRQVVGNTHGLACLLQGGTVVAWGDSAYVTDSLNKFTELFSDSIYANDLCFSILTTANNIYTWGMCSQEHVPERIKEGGTKSVKKVFAAGECFAAILSDGTVATWGKGDQHYCVETGAGATTKYVTFKSVQASLTNIEFLALNKGAFAAVTKDSDIIVWGNIDQGGRLDKKDEAKWVKSNSLVATDGAFGFIRQDGRLVIWGNFQYGGYVSDQFAVLGSTALAASRASFAAITYTKELILWNNNYANYYMYDKEHSSGLKLPGVVSTIFQARHGIAISIAYDCVMSQWTDWSECSKSCGTGIKSRTRTKISESINIKCDESEAEQQSCRVASCSEGGDGSLRFPIGTMLALGGAALSY